MNVYVSIERLVLDGIEIAQRERPLLQAAVEAELGRLLAEGGLSSSLVAGGAYPNAAAGTIQLTNQPSVQLGRQIAQAVYGGIGR